MKLRPWIVASLGMFTLLLLIAVSPIHAVESATPEVKVKMIPSDTPLAKYGDLELSLGHFLMYERDKIGSLLRAREKERKEMQENLLLRAVFEHLMYHQAMEQGYDKESEYILHTRIMENDWLTRFYVFHQFDKDFKANPDDLKQLYEKNKKEYFEPLRFSFRHIFFRTYEMPQDVQDKAKTRAQEAMALIKGGSDFVAVAKQYSDSENKGEIMGPYFTREHDPKTAINPDLEKILLNMKVGDISDIVQTKYGYQILKLETLNPDHYRQLSEVETTLSNTIRTEKREQWTQGILDKYWKEAVTEYNPDVIFKEKIDPQEVIAVIYGQKLTGADFELLKEKDTKKKAEESDEQYRERRIQFLKNPVIFRYIAAKLAKDLGYEQIPRYKEITQTMQIQNVYIAWMNRKEAEYLKENPVTENDKKTYYEDRKSSFLDDQKAHVAEMTFKVPAHNKEIKYEIYKAEQQAQQKAKKAIQRVKAGEKFADVARDMSESTTAKDGGDLGFITAETDKLPSYVAREAINLATGDVCADPIQQEDTFYVVTNYEKPDRKPIAFADPSIQERIQRGALSKKRQDFMNDLMKKMVDKEKLQLLYNDFYTCDFRKIEYPSLDLPVKK